MIYVDVSQLLEYLVKNRRLSGIQRVTLNCVLGLLNNLGEERVQVIAFDVKLKSLQVASANIVAALASHRAQAMFENGVSGLPNLGVFSWKVAEFAKGDRVLLTEWFWNSSVSDAFCALRKSTEVIIYRFIHDVLPLAIPQYFYKRLVREFKANVEDALSYADVILTNSEYSKNDILRLCQKVISPNVPIHVLKLPHEFSGAADEANDAPKAVSKPYALMVGTLEERKNTLVVIKAWRRLWRKHGAKMPMLLLAGKFSWLDWTTLQLMLGLQIDRMRGAPIQHVKNCSDQELTWLYRNCQFSIYVSKYEGWGLPIGESLWFGRPVLAGTYTSLPEVGEDLVDYVNPEDEVQLDTAIETLAFHRLHLEEQSQNIQSARLRTFQDFQEALTKVIAPDMV